MLFTNISIIKFNLAQDLCDQFHLFLLAEYFVLSCFDLVYIIDLVYVYQRNNANGVLKICDYYKPRILLRDKNTGMLFITKSGPNHYCSPGRWKSLKTYLKVRLEVIEKSHRRNL